jgi:predicted nucleic acid-binding protein
MPGAIANASTLIHLASIGRLELLREFHGKILIPPAVWQEVVTEGKGRPGSREVRAARQSKWLEVVPPRNRALVELLKQELDEGEAETIALAVEQQAEVVFLDEADARRAAEIYGLRKTGVIGILMRAKLQGKIGSLKKELDRLREEAGFWIDEQLYQRALESVGEAE